MAVVAAKAAGCTRAAEGFADVTLRLTLVTQSLSSGPGNAPFC